MGARVARPSQINGLIGHHSSSPQKPAARNLNPLSYRLLRCVDSLIFDPPVFHSSTNDPHAGQILQSRMFNASLTVNDFRTNEVAFRLHLAIG